MNLVGSLTLLASFVTVLSDLTSSRALGNGRKNDKGKALSWQHQLLYTSLHSGVVLRRPDCLGVDNVRYTAAVVHWKPHGSTRRLNYMVHVYLSVGRISLCNVRNRYFVQVPTTTRLAMEVSLRYTRNPEDFPIHASFKISLLCLCPHTYTFTDNSALSHFFWRWAVMTKLAMS